MPESKPESVNIRAEGAGSVAAQSIVGSAIATGENAVALVGDYLLLQSVLLPPDSVYTRVALDRFVGREWLEQRVNAFLAAHDRGVFILEAGAGLGKTAFLAHLAKSRGWCQHFVETAPGASGVEPGLLNLAAQLVQHWQLEPYFGAKSLPGRAGRPGFLATLLSAAAAKRDAADPGRRIVLVVDALDESFAPEGQNVLGLPRTLPKGVYLVVSQRPVPVTLDLPGLTPEVVRLEADAAPNRDDMQRFLASAAQRPAIADVLQRCACSPETFAATLAQRCGGVWIYLQYVVTEIEGGNRDPLVLEELPAGVWQYYAEYWQRWRAKPEWASVHLPLIVSLAAAQEDVTVAQLADFSGGVDATVARHLLEGAWRPFITVVPPAAPNGVTRYRCYHASLREFLDGRVDATGFTTAHQAVARELAEATRAAHTRIARRFLDAWGGLAKQLPALQGAKLSLPAEDYGLNHLVSHLAAGDDPRLLKDLLTAEWEEPVERVVQRAGWRGWLDRMRGRKHVILDRRFHNTWFSVKSTRGDLAGYLRDLDRTARAAAEKSRAFLSAGQLAPSIALEARCALMRASVRALAGNLGPKLLEALVAQKLLSPGEARAYAEQTPNDEQRLAALLRVAPHLAEPARTETFRSALATWHTLPVNEVLGCFPRFPTALPDWVWVELVRTLVQRFTHDRYILREALRQLADVVPVTMTGEMRRQADAMQDEGLPILATLARRFPSEHPELRADIETRVARLVAQKSLHRHDVLLPCCFLLPDDQRDAIVASARAAFRERHPPYWIAIGLLDASEPKIREQITDEIVAVLRRLPPNQRLHETAPLLHRLPPAALAELRQVMRESSDAWLERNLSKHEIRHHLERGDRAAARAALDSLGPQHTPYYGDQHCHALTTWAAHAQPGDMPALIEEVLAVPATNARVVALDAVAPAMNREALVRALGLSRTIDDRYQSERTLVDLLKQAAQSSPAPDLLAAAQGVDWYPGQALAAVAPALSPAQRPLAAARAAEIPQTDERVFAQTSLASVDTGDPAAQFTRALQLVGRVKEVSPRLTLLTGLLTDASIRARLTPEQRAGLITRLFDECRPLMQRGETLYDVERTLERVVPLLTAAERTRTLELLAHLGESYAQQRLLHTVVRGRECTPLERWLTCDRLRAATAITRQPPVNLRRKFLEATRIAPVPGRVAALCALVPQLPDYSEPDPQGVVRSAVIAALTLEDPAARTAALQQIRPHVDFFGQRAIDLAIQPAVPAATPQEAWEAFSDLLLQAGASQTPHEVIPPAVSDPAPAWLYNQLLSLPGDLHEAAWLALAESLAPDDVERLVGTVVFYRIPDAARVVPVLRVRNSPALLLAIQSNIEHPPVHGDPHRERWLEALHLMPEPILADGMRRWSEQARPEQRALWMRTLQAHLASAPPLHCHQRWQEILVTTTEDARRRLYEELGLFAPLATRLGGPDTALTLFEAVRQTARWWP